MQKITVIAAIFAACNRAPSTNVVEASASVAPPPAYAFHPLSHPDALGLCEELVDAKVASECMHEDGGTRGAVLAMIAGEPDENHAQIFSFSSPGGYSLLVKQKDVYRGSLRFNLGVVFTGSVPEEKKKRFGEAVDAL